MPNCCTNLSFGYISLSLLGLRCHLEDVCQSNPCFGSAACETSPMNGDASKPTKTEKISFLPWKKNLSVTAVQNLLIFLPLLGLRRM